MEQIGPHTKGVYVISVTPFTDQGDIDWMSVDSLVELYCQGCQRCNYIGHDG